MQLRRCTKNWQFFARLSTCVCFAVWRSARYVLGERRIAQTVVRTSHSGFHLASCPANTSALPPYSAVFPCSARNINMCPYGAPHHTANTRSFCLYGGIETLRSTSACQPQPPLHEANPQPWPESWTASQKDTFAIPLERYQQARQSQWPRNFMSATALQLLLQNESPEKKQASPMPCW